MKKIVTIVSSLALFTSLFALDLSFGVTPQIVFPKNKYYGKFIGGTAQADVKLFNIATVGLEGSYLTAKPNNIEKNMNLFAGGFGAGVVYSPLSRLSLGAGGAFGFSSFSTELLNESFSDLYWRVYGEVGFRINPSLTVNATGGYASYILNKGSPLVSGPYGGISLKINTTVGKKGSGACDAVIKQDENVYPLFQQVYKESPVGTVTITNGESAEIRNVYVSFRAGKYTSNAKRSEKINLIRPMGKVELPLYIEFSSELLKFSEDGKLSGEVVIEYELIGKKKVSVQPVSLSVNNRNSYVWGNNDSLAAFVSSQTPEVLAYAKEVAGIARNNLNSGMNRNIQFAAAMFEALRSSGIAYSADKVSPYTEYHLTDKKDYIQYPLQTMNYLGGDYDDIAILLASCLEASSVPTAFLPLDNDFILLVGMNVKPSQAGNHFGDVEGLIVDDNEVYFGLSMANFDKGFVKSRSEAAKLIKACLQNEDASYEFIVIEDAWTVYKPAIYTGSGSSLKAPSKATIEKNMNTAIKDYISTDLDVVIKNARAEGNTNKLGMAYVRAGRFSEAIAEFEKGAAKGNLSSMNNIGNVLLLQKDYNGAASWFRKVLAKEPKNPNALDGLEKATSKL